MSNRPLTVLCSALSVLGISGTWLLCLRNSSLKLLFNSVFHTHHLPGNTALLSHFTPIPLGPLDTQLQVLTVFFWQAVDGSHPRTSLFGAWFASQHLATSLVVYARGRVGGLSPTAWLLLFQAFGIASAGPVWAYLALVGTDDAAVPAKPYGEKVAIGRRAVSLLLGYGVTLVAMGLPSPGVVSTTFQQRGVAAWNVFPLWVAGFNSILGVGSDTSSGGGSLLPGGMIAARLSYGAVFLIAFAGHMIALSISVATVLFPVLFTRVAHQELAPHAVWTLPSLWSWEVAEVVSMGAGALHFMQWDILVGTLVMLVFVGRLILKGSGSLDKVKLSAALLGANVVLGPGTAVVGAWWYLEELKWMEQTTRKVL